MWEPWGTVGAGGMVGALGAQSWRDTAPAGGREHLGLHLGWAYDPGCPPYKPQALL